MKNFFLSGKGLKAAALAMSLSGALAATGRAQTPATSPLAVPWSTTPLAVQMDGVLAEPAWRDAATAAGFVTPQPSAPATPQTTARIIADADFLYVGVMCEEPQIAQLARQHTTRQSALWSDDCVEIFLDPTHSGAWMYHWIVNPNGALWEGLHATGSGAPPFKSEATAAARIGEKEWSCELKIPWKALMTTPAPGQQVGVNFARERKAGGENQLSSWSASAGSFTDPQILAPAALGRAQGLEIESLGSGAAEFNGTGMNRFVARIPAEYSPATMEVLANGQIIATAQTATAQTATAQTATARRLAVEYSAPRASPLQFRIAGGQRVLFSTALDAPVPTARVWQVPDPLYEPLLGDGPPGLAREGVLMWAHNMSNPNILRQAARRFGLRYVLSEMYQQAGQEQMRLFGAPPSLTNEGSKYWKEAGVKYVYMVGRGEPWVIDPQAVEKSLEALDQQLTRAGKEMWAISASDEVIHRARLEGAKLMADPPRDYAYIHQADEEVRTQFGGGQWGIPHGEKDTNPYRWIAFNKWLSAKFHERAKRIRAVVNKHDPNIKLVSFDPQARVSGDNYSGIAGDYDIFTHQVNQSPSRWRADAGFYTKFLADLTGKDVWPCVHVENYAFATTPAEAREELSQVFRNGGSGFHFYLPDTANGNKLVGDTRLSYFGSPRRYNTILNIVNLTRTMPKLRYPTDARTAILFNDDTLQSTFNGSRVPANSTMACYTFLGPVVRSWFRFIDNNQVLSAASLRQQFDTIYLPSATYQRPEIVAKLRAFVEQGGTLVCGDASAFETDTLGNDTSEQRRQLFGVKTGKKSSPKTLTARLNDNEYSLSVSSAIALQPERGTQVLGTFDDGSAAITAHALGRGRAILFAANPFRLDLVPDEKWREFFTDWAKYLKTPVNLDIWRFQFPDSVLGQDLPVPAGVCLTNNHVTWREEKPVALGNVNLRGKYQLQPAPEAMPDAKGDAQNWIAFEDGHLTDRRHSMLAPKVEPKWYVKFKDPDRRWMVSWKNTARVTATFDLQKPVTPGTLRLWFNDTLPKFTVQGSNDLQNWQPLGENETVVQAGADVFDAAVPLRAAAPLRYVRVLFAPREAEQKLTLVECELWGAAS